MVMKKGHTICVVEVDLGWFELLMFISPVWDTEAYFSFLLLMAEAIYSLLSRLNLNFIKENAIRDNGCNTYNALRA